MKLIRFGNCAVGGEGYERDGISISNFVVFAEKVIVPNAISPDYLLELRSGEKVYSLRVALNEIVTKKFLRSAPVLIEDELVFYQEFRKAIRETNFGEEDTYYQTNHNGLQEIDGRLLYVFSNGCIGEKGFSSQVYSGRSGVYIPEKAVVSLDADVEATRNAIVRLFEIFDCNSKTFYPLFFLNISAICNGYFRMIGEREFMKLTIWLDGDSGSGKTELAKAVGTFAFADSLLNPSLISATSKAKYTMERLKSSSGCVCILDDVKREKVSERRNSVATIVDDILRSTYQGMLTDGSGEFIDACALITGEYMDTQESQNARILYLKVDRFLKEDRNSQALRKLQRDSLLMTTVCCSFIQWFLKKANESSFSQLLLQKLEMMRNQRKEYQGIGNAERLNENINMLRMAQEIVNLFFKDIGMPEEFLCNFRKCAKNSRKSIGDDTFILLGGESMALLKVAENVLRKSKLRKAQFVEDENFDGLCQYCQEEFMVHEGDDFVYIEDMEKSLQLSIDEGHDQYVSHPYLIGEEKHVLSLFMDEIEDMQQTGQISPIIAERLSRNLPQKLKKAQIIFKKNRADNAWGRTAVKYPICNYAPYKFCRDNMAPLVTLGQCGQVSYAPVIQLNTTHACMQVLEERLDQGKYDTSIPSLMRLDYCNTEEEESYSIRRSFTVGKSLYRA